MTPEGEQSVVQLAEVIHSLDRSHIVDSVLDISGPSVAGMQVQTTGESDSEAGKSENERQWISPPYRPEDESSDADYTACSGSECGWCAHCRY